MAKKTKPQAAVPTQDDLLAQLKAQRKVEVLGILLPNRLGGYAPQDGLIWLLTFSFACWRVREEQVHREDLVVRRLIRKTLVDREMNKLIAAIRPNTVTRIQARVAEHSVWDRPEALLEKVIGEDKTDKEMNAELNRFLKPVRFKDEQFGTFTLDRALDWFATRTSWNGRKIQFSLAAKEPDELEKALKVARTLWNAPNKWQKLVHSGAVKELLPLKHTSWRDDEETPLSAAQFAARMELQSITVYPNGEFSFWHDDGDLFSGHNIEVVGNVNTGIRYAGIHG